MSVNEIRGWIAHGLRLARDYESKADWYVEHGLMTRRQREFARWELSMQEWCASRLVHDIQWSPERADLRAWRDYMVDQARLQVRRYASEISEEEFQTAAGVIRRERDDRLRLAKRRHAA